MAYVTLCYQSTLVHFGY